jgi:hypothetical protein
MSDDKIIHIFNILEEENEYSTDKREIHLSGLSGQTSKEGGQWLPLSCPMERG